MAKVNISNVEVLDTHSSFQSPFRFKITFECYEPLEEDLEWRLIYVSSAYNMSLDQTLDSILVGPVPVGKHQFVFEADPPNTDIIPLEDAVGVTVVIVACLYKEQEFIRVGYYVNNEYADEQLRECPPERPQYDRLTRSILADNPRVTRRGIDWGESKAAAAAAAAAAGSAAALFAPTLGFDLQQQQQLHSDESLAPEHAPATASTSAVSSSCCSQLQTVQPTAEDSAAMSVDGTSQAAAMVKPSDGAVPPPQQQLQPPSDTQMLPVTSCEGSPAGTKENCDPTATAADAVMAS